MINSSAPHILIVDDEPKNLQITAQILEEAGYGISLAQDGMSAMALMSHEMPAIKTSNWNFLQAMISLPISMRLPY